MPPKKQEIEVHLTTDATVSYCLKVSKLIENVTKRKWAIDLRLVKELADETEAILKNTKINGK